MAQNGVIKCWTLIVQVHIHGLLPGCEYARCSSFDSSFWCFFFRCMDGRMDGEVLLWLAACCFLLLEDGYGKRVGWLVVGNLFLAA